MTTTLPNRTKRRPKKVIQLDKLKQIHVNAAGLDVGASEIWACMPEGRDEQAVRVFKTFTADLHALAAWLEACQIDTVALESTGVYWIPVYEILEAHGFEVNLVNARSLKNVSGRKSDMSDCQWLQTLHTYGLPPASFRPTEAIAQLRAYVRQRDQMIQTRSIHIQHMQKALHLMNLQLTNVLSDVTGQTGMAILRDIVSGQRDPLKLAQHRHPTCQRSQQEIAKALEGNYRPEHVFLLKQSLEFYDFYNQQLLACDVEIEQIYRHVVEQAQPADLPLLSPKKGAKVHKNDPTFDLRTYLYQLSGVDLTQIAGIEVLTAQTILSEIGPDISPWPTVKHFTSWLGLAPQKDSSGAQVHKAKTKKTKNRVNNALRLAAQALSRSHSALGAFYRRIRAKAGAPVAIVATAHKLARMVYFMLKYRKDYVDPGQDYDEQQYRQRLLKNLKRQAKFLGLDLVPLETAVS